MTKQQIREDKLQVRMRLSSQEVDTKSNAIAKVLLEEIDFSNYKLLHTFLPIKEKREVNTLLIIQRILESFSKTQIATFSDNKTLESVIFNRNTSFREDRLGIPVPTNYGRKVETKQIDVILIPCLAFDKKGNRIGYGKGYYDEFLSGLRPDCLKVGLCFEQGLVEEGIDSKPHDISLDSVITENTLTTT